MPPHPPDPPGPPLPPDPPDPLAGGLAPVSLGQVVRASAEVAGTPARSGKIALVAEVLQRAAAVATPAAAADSGDSGDWGDAGDSAVSTPRSVGDVATVVAYLTGYLPQGRIGVGWRSLPRGPAPAASSTLLVADVDAALTAIAEARGPGSGAVRGSLLADLFARATAGEQSFLAALIGGELRQGAQDGVMLQAIARAAGVPESAVRRAAMLAGRAGPVAQAALCGGGQALGGIGLRLGRPIRPMLAASAPDVATGWPGVGGGSRAVAVEGKLDGIRVQIHKRGSQVRVFTRSLDEVTERLPEVTRMVAGVAADRAVLDGEVIALRADGRPEPFQVTGARTASTAGVAELRERTPLTPFLFDLLHRDGRDLIDEPAGGRFAMLREVVGPDHLVPRLETDDLSAADAFYRRLVTAGHEGVVLKDLEAGYAAGRRGAGWVKVKPRHTLDLVVLAVEWGSGRRRGMLSNIHLGARDPDGAGFVMLGKTFKGMTDRMLAWQTARFLELEVSRSGQVVRVRPEQVVEIAVDGIQASSRYPGGMALRFARVVRYRSDKSASEADTIEAVRALHERDHNAGVSDD